MDKMQENVLYLGMAYDIMAPLLLVPNLTTLYVIDKFDTFFSPDGTFEGQKRDIVNILINGSDIDSHSRKIFMEESNDIHYLENKAKIISEKDDGKVWRLKFEYMDQVRNLVFYHHRDFLEEWPVEIVNVRHVMVMGSFGWYCFRMGDYDCSKALKSMLKERTTESFRFYALWFTHKHFPYKTVVKCGKERQGTEIGIVEVTEKENPKWIRQIYHPDYVNRNISRKEYFDRYLK